MILNSNNPSFNPSFGRLQSATFANIIIPNTQTFIKQPREQIKNNAHNYNPHIYAVAIEKFERRMKVMVLILQSKIVFKNKKCSFDQIFLVSKIPKFKSEAERNIIELLRKNLNAFQEVIGSKIKQNTSIGFNKIMRKAITTNKNSLTEHNTRYSDLNMKQNQNYYNLGSDLDSRLKKTPSDMQSSLGFFSSMHRLLDSHASILNSEPSNRNNHPKVPMSPGLQKMMRYQQSDKSKPKYPPKKQ